MHLGLLASVDEFQRDWKDVRRTPSLAIQIGVIRGTFDLELNGSLLLGAGGANPSVQAWLQRAAGVRADQSHRNSFQQRAFPRAIITGENGPAGIGLVGTLEIKVEASEAANVNQGDLVNVHGKIISEVS